MGDLFCVCRLSCCDFPEGTDLSGDPLLAAPSFLLDSLCSLVLPFLPSVDRCVLPPSHPVSLTVRHCQLPSFHFFPPVILEAGNDRLLCSLDRLFPQNPQSCLDMVPFSAFPRQCKCTYGSGLWKCSAYAPCCVPVGLGLKCFGPKSLHP